MVKKTASKKEEWEKKLKKGYSKLKDIKEDTGEKLDETKEFILGHPFLSVGIAFFAGMMWERMFGER